MKLEQILKTVAESLGLERGSKAWKRFVHGTIASCRKGGKHGRGK